MHEIVMDVIEVASLGMLGLFSNILGRGLLASDGANATPLPPLRKAQVLVKIFSAGIWPERPVHP